MGTLGTSVRQPAYGDPERDEKHYRYSVKCDRAFSYKLEAAARAAGVSVTTFVQDHFDRILEWSSAGPPEAFEVGAFARKHAVSRDAARVWKVMRDRADGAGELRIRVYDIEVDARMSSKDICNAQEELRQSGLAEQVIVGGSKGSLWPVKI